MKHPLSKRSLLLLATNLLPVLAAAQQSAIESITVTARLREEDQEKIPVSVSAVDGNLLESTYTDNTQGITRLVPSLGYQSPNPRNTTYTIRGLGASAVAISQANDGLEPGVGFYVDGVYHGRPATAAFDFSDLERVEVLRGPQGTLFGKNTTAGAINVVTRAPTFDHEFNAELSLGELNYQQVKLSAGGGLSDSVAGRISVIDTRRDGNIHNVKTGADMNNTDVVAVRGQLLYKVSDALEWRLSGDYSKIDDSCCTQVYYGVGATLKPLNKQYAALAAGKNYAPPSLNPYDRLTDIDAALGVDTSEGGISLTGDLKTGIGNFTSISAWRFWNWDAANDRDYIGLQIQTLQHIPSRQDQYSQEFRFASKPGVVDYVAGLYFFTQRISGEPITVYGRDATYWLLGPSALPDSLLDGYGQDGYTKFTSTSYAGFGEVTWHVNDRFALTGGLRYTSENKDGSYTTTVSGGLNTSVTTQINSKLSILRPQSYVASVDDSSPTGRINASYQFTDDVMGYAGYSHGEKSGGINMSGLPLDASNNPALNTAVVKPEKNTTYELGIKSRLFDNKVMFNADVYHTDVKDYQTNVVDTGPGALRSYLANIPKARVQGVELDFDALLTEHLSTRIAYAYTDAKYISYVNGSCPLDKIGSSTTVCDLSGQRFSAQPKQTLSVGGEYRVPVTLMDVAGDLWARVDVAARSSTYGDAADSQALLIGGYSVTNLSIGFKQKNGPWEGVLWARNLFDRKYVQTMTIQSGNSGLILALPGDEELIGATLRVRF
ncbi:MAG TPA: TonB-dependent receptor [Candidatus Acidoferrum sp.]|nr:TonB-dependent receptor [Candidatus Acidoferrum sp.]